MTNVCIARDSVFQSSGQIHGGYNHSNVVYAPCSNKHQFDRFSPKKNSPFFSEVTQ